MELAIPLVALGGLYIVSNQSKKKENFKQRRNQYEDLPNVDVANRNYPDEYPIKDAPSDLTSKLSTVNKFDGQVYTDKYFNPASQNSLIKKAGSQNINQSASTPSQYVSLTGEKVGSDYFQHNNMAPFFGSHLRTIQTNSNAYESVMDNYTGSGSQIISKTERAPMFNPQDNAQWSYGAPNMTDFFQSRVNPSTKMSNVKPFAEERVGPGIGSGYNTDGTGGYNSGLMARDLYLPRTADQMRVDNKPKGGELGLFGHEGPANSYIKTRGDLGIQEKNRVDTTFEMGADRLFTTVGIEKAPTSRAITIEKNMSRPDTTTSYIGVAGGANSEAYQDGEYMPSKHIDLGELPLAPAFYSGSNPNEGDYGMKSAMIYQNNRSANQQDTYYGAFGGVIGAAVAPLLDMLRPSRRENTIGTLRPYQNPGTTVSNSYVFNPADRPAPTIRETTETSNGHLFINGNQNGGGGGYETNNHQPVVNNRLTQSDYLYVGNSSAGNGTREARTYDAEYNQRNNDLKSSTLTGYTPAGGMSLLNTHVNMKAKPQEQVLTNRRALDPTMPYQTASLETFGQDIKQPNSMYSNIQLDRNQGDILSQLKGNPFAISHLNGL